MKGLVLIDLEVHYEFNAALFFSNPVCNYPRMAR